MPNDTHSNGGGDQNPTATRPAASPPTVTIHVVCRDCPFEQLVEGHTRDAAIASAKEAQLTHAIEEGHTQTVPGVVADPSCNVCGRVPLTTTVIGPDAEHATHDCGHTPAEVQR